MPRDQNTDSIEIDQDLEFQRRSWRVQRVGWSLMLFLTIAALMGLFGGGLLSMREATAPGSPLRVEYDRFPRSRAPTRLVVDLEASAVAADSTATVWIDRDWLDDNEVKVITPEPERSDLTAREVIYTFRVVPGSARARVTFSLQSRGLGRSNGRVGLVGGPAHDIRQFIYP